MSVCFSMAGKIGDALHQYPIAYWWARENGKQITLWLDQGMLKPLVPLFEAQPCVEAVELKPGITTYHLGGQPWDFGLKTEDYQGKTVYHLGFRQFPQTQITRDIMTQVPQVRINATVKEIAATPSFVIPDKLPSANRLILHGTFTAPNGGSPGFWRFLAHVRSDLETLFDEIVFTGTPAERARALEVYPEYRDFDDEGNFLNLARYMAASRCVIGSGSSGIALAGQLKVPSIRVHDPIGDAPKVIWSNLQEAHLNDTERLLRPEWPKFRDKYLLTSAETSIAS
jgi:hypothetical protein